MSTFIIIAAIIIAGLLIAMSAAKPATAGGAQPARDEPLLQARVRQPAMRSTGEHEIIDAEFVEVREPGRVAAQTGQLALPAPRNGDRRGALVRQASRPHASAARVNAYVKRSPAELGRLLDVSA